jgi:hypothetical protein
MMCYYPRKPLDADVEIIALAKSISSKEFKKEYEEAED